ncbi:MAG TPA: glycosyltransferase family 2 protein [Anaerolineales bacterium]|jgi:glycosyltransferase involved in cell wall biosynthesis|nr:glycosyltransferase family 2 protein [Anaerolineales bacterium]|tara:strand:+ start:727 stop:1707 length:981 start_codon:yes stop_codon:yes gene_type:complete
MASPRVSVVIATHNRAGLVGQAIKSALGQSVRPAEIIVVDDGSSDATPQMLSEYGNDIRIIHQPNRGRSAARNAGVEHAQGDIITFLDSDDVWLPEKLEKQLAAFEVNPSAGLQHTFSDVVDAKGAHLPRETRHRRQLYRRALRRGYTYEGMSQECIMFLSTVAVRRECWARVGPMDASIPAFEDWDWYLRAAMQTEIATVPEVLVHFRKHAGNTSSQDFFEGRVKTCHKHLDLLTDRMDSPRKERTRRNFYVQLAAAHYVHGNSSDSGKWMCKAVAIDPAVFFRPSHLRHSLAMCLSEDILMGMRRAKRWITGRCSNNTSTIDNL